VAVVAVTGATGFIGSAVVRQLLAQGRRVRALIEPGLKDKRVRNLDGLDVDRVTVDVTNLEQMRKALDGCETLFHLAAVYKTWLPNPEILYRVNLEGTVATLLAARHAKLKRIIYTSSIAAVGLKPGGEADETNSFDIFDVADPYILSKWQSERIALRFAEDGLPIVVVNPAFPFGPGDVAPTPTGKILIGLLREIVPAVGPGGICSIDVDDVATGHLLAETKGRIGERYILGNENVTFKQLFEVVGRVSGCKVPKIPAPAWFGSSIALGMELYADHVSHKEPPATYRSLRYAQKNAFFSNAKAKKDLGLPTRPLEETVRRAVDWFRAEGMA
jgi:dihydroflavonol-4-reductase